LIFLSPFLFIKEKKGNASLFYSIFQVKRRKMTWYFPSLFLEKRLDKKSASSKALAPAHGLMLPPQRTAQAFAHIRERV
jgi:hypothetical protein